MKGHIVTEELIEQMRKLRQDGMSCRQAARELGISKTTVCKYTQQGQKPTQRKPRLCITLCPPQVQEHRDVLYDVEISLVRKHPDLVIRAQLDHRPTYSDMMALCKQHDLPAVDFEDDRGTKMEDRIYHGTVYAGCSRAFYLARFTIQRLKGDVRIEDFFR